MAEPVLRSRYLINKKEKIILFVNYKCGFTSINDALSDNPDFDFSVRDPGAFRVWSRRNRIAEYSCNFISRNPLSRLVSFYYDWIVSKGERYFSHLRNEEMENIHFRNLQGVMTADDYQLFSAASSLQKASCDMFAKYLRYLPEVFMLDPHTLPQHYLATEAGVEFGDIDRIVDTARISTELAAILNTRILQLNKGSRNRTSLTASIDQRIVTEVYAEDYKYLGYSDR